MVGVTSQTWGCVPVEEQQEPGRLPGASRWLELQRKGRKGKKRRKNEGEIGKKRKKKQKEKKIGGKKKNVRENKGSEGEKEEERRKEWKGKEKKRRYKEEKYGGGGGGKRKGTSEDMSGYQRETSYDIKQFKIFITDAFSLLLSFTEPKAKQSRQQTTQTFSYLLWQL